MKSSFLLKYEPIIVSFSALYCATLNRAEILTIFRSYFEKNDHFVNWFWNLLTFSMRFNEAFKNMSSHFQHPAVVHSALFLKASLNLILILSIYVSRFQGNVSTYFTPNLFIAYGGIQCLRRQEEVGRWSKKDQILST